MKLKWHTASYNVYTLPVFRSIIKILNVNTILYESQDSSVGKATSYGLDDRGSIPGRVKRFFSISQNLDCLWGPPSLLSYKYWGLLPRVYAAGALIWPLPYSAEVKNSGDITPLPNTSSWYGV
jgi:hypothetical protein